MSKNKKLEIIFDGEDTLRLPRTLKMSDYETIVFKVNLKIYEGDKYDIVYATQVLKEPQILSLVESKLIPEVITKYNLKRENTKWIEDMRTISTNPSGKIPRLLDFVIDKNICTITKFSNLSVENIHDLLNIVV